MLTKFHLLNDRHACFSMSKYICTLLLALLSPCGLSLWGYKSVPIALRVVPSFFLYVNTTTAIFNAAFSLKLRHAVLSASPFVKLCSLMNCHAKRIIFDSCAFVTIVFAPFS